MESKENFSSVFWGRKDEIFEKIESFSGKSCILCNPEISENCNSSNENISDHFIKKHFNHAVEFEVKGRKGFSLPCRKQECLNRKSETEARRSHFHCPFCLHVFGRSRPLKHHLVTKNGECGSIKSSSDIQLPSTSTDRICNQEVHRKGFMCKICSQCFSSTIALRRHGEKKHGVLQSILPCVTIDAVNGIFMVAISSKGPLAPIHVKKNVLQSASVCTNEECMYLIKHLSIMNPGYECQHLLAVQYSQIAETVFLQQFYLNELRRLNSISDNSCQKCLQLQEASLQAHAPLLVYVDFESLGYSGRMKYFSVFCEEESYFSPLCRVRVTFDYDKSQFFCQCSIAKGDNVFCVHQNIAKWYMCQYQREWLEASEPVRRNILLPFDEAMMAYFLKEKRIPTSLPHYILDDAAPPKLLMPSEKNCPICKGVAFTEKSKKVTVYGMGKLWHDITLVTKKCISCQGLIRFQNYQSGFHNFDNTFMLTVKLCSYLIRGIENHVCIERNLKTLFYGLEDKLPISKFRNAVYHFCALQEYSYDFLCYKCGTSPKILVGDGNWKNTCQIPIDDLKRDEHRCYVEDINPEEVWLSYCKEIIGRGFFGPTNNPWKVDLKFDKISPWMGLQSRRCDTLLNTEFKKGHVLSEKECQGKHENCSVTHEDVLNSLHSPQQNTSNLRTMCETIGINSAGSRDDIVHRLNELILFKELYPKVYRQIRKCGGGIVHFRCPHGICVYFKYIARQESARDYIDGLLSLKRQPVVFISDISSQVAHHGENRQPGMFRPYKGMLYEWTPENLKLQKEGTLPLASVELSNNNGLKFYSLSDRFHARAKKKSPEESLLCCSNLKEINTSIAEQTNFDMSKDRYSFCEMDPVNFLFMSRLSLHLKNESSNNRFTKRLKRHAGGDVKINSEGFAIPIVKDRRLLSRSIPSDSARHTAEKIQQKVEVFDSSLSINKSVEKNESTEIADELLASSSSFEKEPSPRKLIPRKFLDIEELWGSHHDGDRVESVFGNVVLKKKSLCLLQGSNWLDDVVIDAALEALCIENEDWNTVSSQYGSLWFHKGRFTRRNSDWVTARFMKPVITIINTGAHWVFLAIDVDNAEVFMYDPLGRENTIAPTITTNLTSFQKFYNLKVHKLNASYEDAKVVIHSHNIQQDTHSCGPLSIMAAQQYMKNEFQEFREASTDCNAIRIAIGNMLLRHCDEENLDEFCVHCSKTTSRSTAWYACDQCCRWIHESCSAEPAENEQFLCKHCTI